MSSDFPISFCPGNIESVVVDANDRFPADHDQFNHYFRLKCPCGGWRFGLCESNKRSLLATCESCRREWRIYDLADYPAATKSKGDEVFDQVLVPNEKPRAIFIGFEYGELDDDQEFDRNCISWCTVWVETEGRLEKVFDDETA